jgi:hypothetical protein
MTCALTQFTSAQVLAQNESADARLFDRIRARLSLAEEMKKARAVIGWRLGKA